MLKIYRAQKRIHTHFNKFNLTHDVLTFLSKSTLNTRAQGHALNAWRQRIKSIRSYKARNVCFLTGRTRAVTRRFRMSRMCFRVLANSGFFLGVRKTSW